MMTLQEVLTSIDEAKKARDFMKDLSPGNSMIIQEKCGGKFEAVTINGSDKICLIPQIEGSYFLFRGQNQEYIPCYPSIYRGNPSESQIFINRMRLMLFKHLIESHPVVNQFFKKNRFFVDIEGLAQHYGLSTSMLDLTNNIDVAMFFATCKYNSKNDSYEYFNDDEQHEAVLYLFDPLFDNEPCPSNRLDIFNGDIKCIGLQPFLRPAVQCGFSLHIEQGCSTKSYMYRFTYTSADSKYYFDKFMQGETLWVKDELISKTKQIISTKTFSFKLFNETFMHYRPKGFSKTSLKNAVLADGITLKVKEPLVVFSENECKTIINRWNNGQGKEFSKIIIRRPWYEHEGIDSDNKITGIKNNHDYRSLQRLSLKYLLASIIHPQAPQGAEWMNYMNTPLSQHKKGSNKSQSSKIPAYMEDFFGENFLTEEDWKIS